MHEAPNALHLLDIVPLSLSALLMLCVLLMDGQTLLMMAV